MYTFVTVYVYIHTHMTINMSSELIAMSIELIAIVYLVRSIGRSFHGVFWCKKRSLP